MPPVFDKEKCVQCEKCVSRCPGYVLEMEEETPKVVFPNECWHCGCCRIACEADAVTFVFPLHTRL
jgi:NAD-dependent dihydropyrimidine dehydrogenase PreA subunit